MRSPHTAPGKVGRRQRREPRMLEERRLSWKRTARARGLMGGWEEWRVRVVWEGGARKRKERSRPCDLSAAGAARGSSGDLGRARRS
eukprot:1271471-Pyramimonas_sp.AAC.1